MIDSVVMRIHRASQTHRQLFSMLSIIDQEAVSTNVDELSTTVSRDWVKHGKNEVVNLITGEMIPFRALCNKTRNTVRYGQTEQSKPQSVYGKVKLYSGHQGIAFAINYEQDTVTFSCSVPKFYFGTNVHQYISNICTDKRAFQFSHHSDFDNQAGYLYRDLTKFVDDFFGFLSKPWTVDYKHIEITRVDLCYNQIFKTKEQALEYLRICSLVKKKYARKTLDNYTDYGTTILYKCNLYSCKIYHKGTEFLKEDYKALQKRNLVLTKNGKQPVDTDALKDLADRTLRYEMTCHSKFLSDVFINYHEVKDRKLVNAPQMRRNCPIHRKRVKLYKELHALHMANKRAEKAGETVPKSNRFKVREENFYKDFSAYKSKRHKFFLKWNLDYLEAFKGGTIPLREWQQYYFKTPVSAHFPEPAGGRHGRTWLLQATEDLSKSPSFSPVISQGILWSLSRKFKDFILQFKIEKRPTMLEVKKAIQQYNSTLKARKKADPENTKQLFKLNEFSTLQFFKDVYAGESMDTLLEGYSSCRTTVYRFKCSLAAAGIDVSRIVPFSFDYDLSYTVYQKWLAENRASMVPLRCLTNHEMPSWAAYHSFPI